MISFREMGEGYCINVISIFFLTVDIVVEESHVYSRIKSRDVDLIINNNNNKFHMRQLFFII